MADVVQQIGPSGVVDILDDGTMDLKDGNEDGAALPISCWDTADGTEIFNHEFRNISGWLTYYDGNEATPWTPATTADMNRSKLEATAVADTTTRYGHLLVQSYVSGVPVPYLIYDLSSTGFDATADWTVVTKVGFVTPLTALRGGSGDNAAIGFSKPNWSDGNINQDSIHYHYWHYTADGYAQRGAEFATKAETECYHGNNVDMLPYGGGSAWIVMTHVAASRDYTCYLSWDGLSANTNRVGVISKDVGDELGFTHLFFHWVQGGGALSDNYIQWVKYVRVYQSLKLR